jgi:hypothetical protein
MLEVLYYISKASTKSVTCPLIVNFLRTRLSFRQIIRDVMKPRFTPVRRPGRIA